MNVARDAAYSADREGSPPPPRRVLLTGLGTSAQETSYQFEGRNSRQPLAPLALIELVGPFDEVVAVCTEEAAQKTLPLLQAAADAATKVRVVDVPSALSSEQVAQFVETVARQLASRGAIESQTRLVVDLTHGFRHQAVLTYVITLYLVSLGRVQVEHVFYGAQEQGQFVDLTPLLVLPRLTHAVHVVRETGSTRALAQVIGDVGDDRRVKSVLDVKSALDALARQLLAGLPLEAGIEWESFERQSIKPFNRSLRDQGVPLVDELLADLQDTLGSLSTSVGSERRSESKRQVILDEEELRRQATLIDLLFGWEMDWAAIGLLREWLVSWVLWCEADGAIPGGDWLRREQRELAANRLHALEAFRGDRDLAELLSDGQRRVAEFWHSVCELRNAYMHFGMRPGWVDARKPVQGEGLHRLLEQVRERWAEYRACPRLALPPDERTGRVLVSAQGLSSGVLTNAIRHAVRPAGGDGAGLDHVIVVCSQESAETVGAAVEQSAWRGPVSKVLVPDPMDVVAVTKLVRPGHGKPLLPEHRDVRRLLAAADEVLVNLTGGTTAMMLGVQLIAEGASRYQRRVRRFLLADRRSPEEQRRDPWAECEAIWLEERDEDHDDDGEPDEEASAGSVPGACDAHTVDVSRPHVIDPGDTR